MNDDTPAGEATFVRTVTDELLARILRDAFASLRSRRSPGLARISASIVPALVLTLAVFYLMGRLLFVPVAKSGLPIPLIIHIEGVAQSESQTPPNASATARALWRSALLPPLRLPELEIAPQVAPMAMPPIVATATAAAQGVDWTQAVRNYLNRPHDIERGPFEMPKLPARPPSVLALPERMRLSTGGEIDRIGKHCYTASSDITYNAEASGAPEYTRYVHRALSPLFVHEVSCDPAVNKTWGEDFLGHLNGHGYAPPKP